MTLAYRNEALSGSDGFDEGRCDSRAGLCDGRESAMATELPRRSMDTIPSIQKWLPVTTTTAIVAAG